MEEEEKENKERSARTQRGSGCWLNFDWQTVSQWVLSSSVCVVDLLCSPLHCTALFYSSLLSCPCFSGMNVH